MCFYRDHQSGGGGGGVDECGEPQPTATTDDVCPWEMADGTCCSNADKKRSLPTSIAEEHGRRPSTSSSSRKNSGGAATAYDSASADESQSDSVANRLRRSCGLGGDARSRRGSSCTTSQHAADRPSVSSAEDFDIGPSPESRSPEKQPSASSSSSVFTSPHEQQSTSAAVCTAPPDAKHEQRKSLLKSLSLTKKQGGVTPVINVSSVDRDTGCVGGKPTANVVEQPKPNANAAVVSAAGCGTGRDSSSHEPAAVVGSESDNGGATASNADGNDVCPWEDE